MFLPLESQSRLHIRTSRFLGPSETRSVRLSRLGLRWLWLFKLPRPSSCAAKAGNHEFRTTSQVTFLPTFPASRSSSEQSTRFCLRNRFGEYGGSSLRAFESCSWKGQPGIYLRRGVQGGNQRPSSLSGEPRRRIGSRGLICHPTCTRMEVRAGLCFYFRSVSFFPLLSDRGSESLEGYAPRGDFSWAQLRRSGGIERAYEF